jgi:queuosine precursor transporter
MESSQHRQYKYFDLVTVAFITVLLCSCLIGPGKVCTLFGVTFGAGVFFYPISYIFGDVLTEVYGYSHTRRAVWAGFGALIFASLMSYIVLELPPSAEWPYQEAYVAVLGQTSRVVIGTLLSFWAGELVNSYVLAKLKIKTGGRFLWLRTIGSTLVGQGVDTVIFYPIAFAGLWSVNLLLTVMVTNYILKVMWEAVSTPLTYKVVGFLKNVEREDHYDIGTDFTPFALQTSD